MEMGSAEGWQNEPTEQKPREHANTDALEDANIPIETRSSNGQKLWPLPRDACQKQAATMETITDLW